MENTDKSIYKITVNVNSKKTLLVHVPKNLIHSDEKLKFYLDLQVEELYLYMNYDSYEEPNFYTPIIEKITNKEYLNTRSFEINEVLLTDKSLPNSLDFDTMIKTYPNFIHL